MDKIHSEGNEEANGDTNSDPPPGLPTHGISSANFFTLESVTGNNGHSCREGLPGQNNYFHYS
jgi:hypothetical protein